MKRKRFLTAGTAGLLAVTMLAACGSDKSLVDNSVSFAQEDASSQEGAGTESEARSVDGVEISQDAKIITMNGNTVSLDGETVEEYDYTWHCDPTSVHDEVKDAPAEYYTGTKPETEAAVYIDHELYYYPELPEDGFSLVNYDGEKEWVYYYQDGENDDYIFGTLPALGNALPTQMMHSEEEAAENKVLHITEAGEYVLEGAFQGQVLVDLGEEAATDENAVVTLVLNNANISCSVAPGIVFKNVYECDNTWEDRDSYDVDVDTEKAGARLVLADDSENAVSGKNIFRMLKTKYKDEEDTAEIKTQKKVRKIDAALYSYMTMNIYGGTSGNGKLTVDSGFEGIDSELHLSVYGGDITVNSQDDGMNVNEDNVSVIAFYGGSVTINGALGQEGDGVDSNGFIKVDGGILKINGIRVPDSALDSDAGITYLSGQIIIDGEEQSYEAGSVFKETGERGGPGGMKGPRGDGEKPEGMSEPPKDGERPEGMPEPPKDGERPEGMPEPPKDGERPEGMPEPPMDGEKPEGIPEPSKGAI